MKHHRNDTQTPGTPINIVVGRAVMDGTMIQSGPGTVMVFCNGYQVELDDDYMAEKSVGKVDGIEAFDLFEIYHKGEMVVQEAEALKIVENVPESLQRHDHTGNTEKTTSGDAQAARWANLKVHIRVSGNDCTRMCDTVLKGHPTDVLKEVVDVIGPDFVLDALRHKGGIHIVLLEDK